MFLFSRDKNSISVLSAEALKNRITDKIVQLRKDRRLTQSDIADKMGISVPAYQKIESGKTDLNFEKAFNFCEIFEITMTELLGLDEVISSKAHEHIASLEKEKIKLRNELNEKSLTISLLHDKLLGSINFTEHELIVLDAIIEKVIAKSKMNGEKSHFEQIGPLDLPMELSEFSATENIGKKVGRLLADISQLAG